MIFSKKAEQISPSITLSIDAKAKAMKAQGIDVIGFGAGEPDFNTPINIQQAAIDAIKNGFTKYTAASGIKELKDAIINKFKIDNNLIYSSSQIIVSTGAKQCLSNAFQSILNPGDEVIIPIPYWVSYPELVKLSDGVPVFVETDEKNFFKYTIESLQRVLTNKSKVLLLNSPSNPTGTVYSKEELHALAEFARENDLIIISDEIYEKLIYGEEKHISIASISEDAYNRTIVINGVSKSYAMTGWRIGYAACGNEKIAKLMSNIQSHTTSNPNSIAQYAAVEALTGPQDTIEYMIKEFKSRRDYMVDRINSMKYISCIKPSGAFYVMINITDLLDKKVDGNIIENSLNFSSILLEKEKVAVVPGSAFGVDNYIRLSYATSIKNIEIGLDRLEHFLNNL
ncbi:pyridoxal phosphate-dependent aminotransferase [Clostridium sp. SYSU_GA19001]|uniref:pyridoxal phosphate-dependent aminotransferase n=1 Tax=Clostridium caldaquaticum TaxID=2940653 RepID=UPI0020774E75|nr:pyridoxal phosphate-dependent aminotransferase [Clostridium caldaquaticum]MCM8710646.1 pyridoxal phosphate-dependent aminotransferase [Clostridium caldaquaticum]